MTFRPIRAARVAPCVLLAFLPLAASAQFAYRTGPFGHALLNSPFPPPTEDYSMGVVRGNFDGDSEDDLVVVANGQATLNVLFGLPWVIGTAVPGNKFAFTTFTPGFTFDFTTFAAGDFDADGRDELVISHSGYSAVAASAGRVYVMKRAVGGGWSVQETIEQGSNGYAGGAEANDRFGSALAVGDFDNDGFDDLAIGAYGEDVGSTNEAGAVTVAYGSATGITAARDVIFTRDNDGLSNPPATLDRYGYALASGDFNDDGYDDLAIGVPRARCPFSGETGGAVVMLLGSASGIVATGSKRFNPGLNDIDGGCNEGGGFGSTLVSGRFDAGLRADLAVSTLENGVHVIYASATGALDEPGNQLFTPASLGGATITESRFGRTLASGRLRRPTGFSAVGLDSLAISAGYDTVNGLEGAGSLTVIHATTAGLDPASAERITHSANLQGSAAIAGEHFGNTLAIGNFNGDVALDLAIGVNDYPAAGSVGAGAMYVLYGSEFIFRDGFD